VEAPEALEVPELEPEAEEGEVDDPVDDVVDMAGVDGLADADVVAGAAAASVRVLTLPASVC